MSRRNLLLILYLCVFAIAITASLVIRQITMSTSTLDNPQKTSILNDQEKPIHDQIQERLNLASDIFDSSTADLPEMIDSHKIRVLTTYTFNNFFTFEGEPHGYEYSLMEEYGQFLNSGIGKGGLKIETYYIPLPYDLLIPALNKGFGDIVAANMTIRPERTREVYFTDPYQWDIKEVLVSSREMKNIRNIEQLGGKKIHVREGSSYHMSLKELNKRLTGMNLLPVEIETLPGVIHTSDILEMVSANVIRMTIADSHIAAIAESLLPNLKIHDHIVFNDDVRYGWMVRKNNPRLQASLNTFIQTIKKGTLKGNIYFNRYFTENPWGKNALKREDFNKCCEYVPLFRKYGELYDIDWMLVAAQAYQESRLNPQALSPNGAIGLMQLLPATAREMGFKNIHLPEDNIHAGVKYLRWIMENYFTDGEISEDDRVRFALAAYNAGPSKIRESRNVTDEMGYDSFRWFGNSELGTMKHVGPEPVHYVRSVNKNYLAFALSKVLTDLEEERFEMQ